MSRLRWPLVALLFIALAAVAAKRFWPETEIPLGTASEEAALAYREGSDALRRLELETARSSLESAIEADPSFAMAHFELGHALFALGERDAGVEAVLRADSLALEPGLTTELDQLVIGLTAATIGKDPARAEDQYERLVRDYGEHPLSLRAQAQRAIREGDPGKGRKLYLAALDADPDRVEIHNTLGYLALEQGQYEEAVASFKRYAYFAGGAANPHDSLGEAYLRIGRYHESVEEYLAALEIDPSFLSSVIGATDALAVTGQFRLSKKLLDSFEELFVRRNQQATREVKLLQTDYQAEDWTAVAARAIGLREDAQGFARLQPQERLWINTLGTLALAEMGQSEQAAALLAEVEESIDGFLAQMDEANLAHREELQLLQAAVHCRLALVEDRPASTELAALRGLLESSNSHPHRLLPYQGVLVLSLYEAGLDAEALDFAPRILEFNPRHPRTLLVCAEASARQRDRDAALGYLQRYLEVMREADPGHPRVERARQLLDRLAPSS